MLFLICDAFDPSLPKRLARFGEVTEDAARLAEADVALVRSKTKCTAEWIAQAPRLRLIIRGGVGVDNIDAKAAKERGIEVRNTPNASSVAVAELAFALMIAVPNRLIEAHNALKLEGKFLKKEIKRTELMGKTLGLVGLGRIAQELGKRARAFGMRVLAFDPYVKTSDAAILVPTLKELFQQADYLSLHTPLTDETRGMINKDSIANMKQRHRDRQHRPRQVRRRGGSRRGAQVGQGRCLRDRRLVLGSARPGARRCSRRRTCS